MKAVTWHGKRDVRVDKVPDPTIEEPTDAIVRDHVDRHLRLGPAPLRGARRRSWTRATSSATSRWASSRRSAPRSRTSRPGDRVVIPFNISCGHCFMCDQGLLLAVRDDAGARAGHGRRAVRLHQALRPGARRAGRVPARPAGAVRADQGARRPARRPLRLPLRRAAHGLAGGRVRRRCPTAARVAVLGLGPDRRHVRAASRSTAARPGDRRRPRARAPRAWPRRHGVEPFDLREHGDDRRRRDPRAAPTAAARTRSSTPSAWRRTARRCGKLAQQIAGAAARRGRRSS